MSAPRPPRRLAAPLLTLLAVAVAALAQAPEARFDPQTVAAIRARLAPPQGGPPPILEELVGTLATLGPRAVPELFAELAGELERDEDAPPVGAREEGALLGALAALPEAAVLAELDARCTPDAPLARKIAALRVLERRASAGGISTWLALAQGIEPLQREGAFVADPLRRALARMLGRDEQAAATLERRVPHLEPELAELIGAAAVASKRPEALRVVLALCERRPGEEREASLLAAATALVADNDLPAPESVVLAVRQRLFASHAALRAQAVASVQRLEITGALPELIELLGDDDRRVQRQARVSLEALSGQRLGYAPDPWRRWWAEQERWLAGEGMRCVRSLAEGAPSEVVHALGELAQRRLLRDELVEPVSLALQRPEAELVVAACAALAQLGSPRAAPWLLALLDDGDEGVRKAAWAALRALLRAELPPERAAWSALLEAREAS